MITRHYLLLSLLLFIMSPSSLAEVLPWFHDNYEAAQKDAQKNNRPLLIDFWAPWCPSCLQLKANVFDNPSSKKYHDTVTWLSINTDNPINATTVEKFPIQVWPTILLIDADRQSDILARVIGMENARQLDDLMYQAHQHTLLLHNKKQSFPPLPIEETLQKAEQLAATQKFTESIAMYHQLFEATNSLGNQDVRVIDGYFSALAVQKNFITCRQWAEKFHQHNQTKLSSEALFHVATWSIDCLDFNNPDTLEQQRKLFTILESSLWDYVREHYNQSRVYPEGIFLKSLPILQLSKAHKPRTYEDPLHVLILSTLSIRLEQWPQDSDTQKFLHLSHSLALVRAHNAHRYADIIAADGLLLTTSLAKKEYHQAEDIFYKHFKKYPKDLNTSRRLVSLLMAQKKWRQAIEPLNIVILSSQGKTQLRYLLKKLEVLKNLNDMPNLHATYMELKNIFDHLPQSVKENFTKDLGIWDDYIKSIAPKP